MRVVEKLIQNQKVMSEINGGEYSHILFVLPVRENGLAGIAIPYHEKLNAAVTRRGMKMNELIENPISCDLDHGAMAVWVMLDISKSRFEQLTIMRKALDLLLTEHPQQLAISVYGNEKERRNAASVGLYTAWVNGARLMVRKKKMPPKPLKSITLFGYKDPGKFADLKAKADGNLLARELTLLPANELTPGLYRERIRHLAKVNSWKVIEFDMKKLRKLSAGAFVAVAQGSADEDAAIVRVRYTHKDAKKTVALVGKGICFDTGGHNLKPAKYMHGMHEDMNGSAVALGILLAATRQKLPVNIDCWVALAQNHISPKAYKQNDVVTALNGTTIEIIHTDAEGRMVLADTLTLASSEKPDFMIDFATLTGSCVTALGNRYSGVFSNRDALISKALDAGIESGERVCAFPMDSDYEVALDSKVADIKQCTLDGEADHILAAKFLQRFVDDTPWIHMDLSASRCDGGLGAVASDVTGFGVAWGMRMLKLTE